MKKPLEEKANFISEALFISSKLLLILGFLHVIAILYMGISALAKFFSVQLLLVSLWGVISIALYYFIAFALCCAIGVIVESTSISAMLAQKKYLNETYKK